MSADLDARYRRRNRRPGRPGRRARRRGGPLLGALGALGALVALVALYVAAILIVPPLVAPPTAVGIAAPARADARPRYLTDDSWLDPNGERRLEQTIFDHALAMIGRAERLVYVDMFLFNDWQGPDPETHRRLADALAAALRERRRERPELAAVLVTDPINTVYGGLRSPRLDALGDAGVEVVLSDLVPLQDSNRLWSGLWRVLVRPFGNAPGGSLPNPLGPGTVTLRSYLALANFKANHRKLLVADDAEGVFRALVTSANPHDGSAAHRNTALAFEGAAALDLLAAERTLLALSGAERAIALLDLALAGRTAVPASSSGAVSASAEDPGASVQVLGERRIEEAALELLAGAGDGARVDLTMFYLADRDLIAALLAAHRRGARVRVLLDVNRDAFGRAKNGVPNRPVAAELDRAGVAVRWCATAGEQCHAKQLYVGADETHGLLLGSANFTRRNLHDLNLETDVRVTMGAETALARRVRAHFDRQWDNTAERTYSLDYETHADESPWLMLQYRLMEATGLSTF